MTTMVEWLRDWRKITGQLKDGKYVSINQIEGNDKYEVLRVSTFDTEIDGGKTYVSMPISTFEDQVAMYSRRTRETGLIRVVTAKGAPRFIVEPGGNALEWMAAVEGVKLESLVLAMRNGSLWRSIARRVTENDKRAKQLVEAQIAELKERLQDAEFEASRLRMELRSAEKELGRYGLD